MGNDAEPSSCAQALIEAVASCDWLRADHILKELDEQIPPQALEAAASVHMQQHRWRQAGRLLNRVIDRSAECEMNRRLCRNMAAMKDHRPAVYDRLVQEIAGPSPFEPIIGANGVPSIVYRRPDGGTVLMSPKGDPQSGLAALIREVEPTVRNGEPLTLLSIADGYLLAHLAANPPKLVHSQQQVIAVLEPDAALLIACMRIHDYSGATGPIQQPRFVWFIGGDCFEQLQSALEAEPTLPLALMRVSIGLEMSQRQQRYDALVKWWIDRDAKIARRVAAYYEGLSDANLAAAINSTANAPPTPGSPRVLLLTSRFTTVLQYAARDTCDAFERLGWRTHLLIEPADHHRVTHPAIRAALDQFRPDLVFVIDHLRYEYPAMFPPKLPFACWIQDHLPKLTCDEAADSIGQRDFVLTAGAPNLHQQYGYPLDQCIRMTKATRIPPRPRRWEQDGADLVFVSNCSRHIEQIVEELMAGVSGASGRTLISACCSRMIELYERGESLPRMYHVRKLLERTKAELRVGIRDEQTTDRVARLLWHPLNDALYRQQALRWIINTVVRRGLSLELYGNGWDQHPQFAPYARGYVDYGPKLQELARRSKINLHIAPISCLHQRVLDGLAAGGIFMIRDNPANRPGLELFDFIALHCERRPLDLVDAMRMIDRGRHEELSNLLDRYADLFDGCDPIRWMNDSRRREDGRLLPRYDEVCFTDEADFEQRAMHLLEDRARRDSIALDQRAYVEAEFTYEAQIRRVVEAIGGKISQQCAASDAVSRHAG